MVLTFDYGIQFFFNYQFYQLSIIKVSKNCLIPVTGMGDTLLRDTSNRISSIVGRVELFICFNMLKLQSADALLTGKTLYIL